MEELLQQDGNAVVIGPDAEVNGQNSSHEESEATKSSLPVTAATKYTSAGPEASTAPQDLSPKPSPPPTAASSPNPVLGLNVQASESQPMTAVSSTSSSIPIMHGSSNNDAGGPSPYGTRSRNRAGTNRINYAEDREVDNEYEWSSTKKAHVASTTSSSAQMSENDKTSTSARRRSLQGAAPSTSTRSNGAIAGAFKDHIPGTSSFSVNSDTNGTSHPQSKKRKAPGTHAANSQSSSLNSTSTTTRPAHHAPASSGTVRETNMLTFEKSQGYLKHGKLVADDGTRLGINGKNHDIGGLRPGIFQSSNTCDMRRVANWAYRLCLSSLRTSWGTLLYRSYNGVPALRQRHKYAYRNTAYKLGISSTRYWPEGQRHAPSIRFDALRYLPTSVTTGQMPGTTQGQDRFDG